MLKTSKDMIQVIASLGRPHANTVHNTVPAMPFFTYTIETEEVFADGCTFMEIDSLTVQIVSNKREFALETQMKNALSLKQIQWTYDTTYYNPEEKTFLTQYTLGG